MDLIQGLVLFFGAIATVALLGWDTIQNREPITKAEMQQSRGARPANPKTQRRGLFNRG